MTDGVLWWGDEKCEVTQSHVRKSTLKIPFPLVSFSKISESGRECPVEDRSSAFGIDVIRVQWEREHQLDIACCKR